MRRFLSRILLLCLAAAVLPSCEHMDADEATAVTADGSNVVIRVSEMQSGWDNAVSRNMVNISEVCSRLCFAVYQNGERVKSKNQQSGDSDFGTYNLQLAAGSYQVLIIGHSGQANPATTNAAKIQFTNPSSSGGTGFTDTFYYYGALEVSSEGAQMDVSMQRATAQFQLVTSDVKPSGVQRFQFYYEGGSGCLNAMTGWGCVKSKQSVFVETADSLTGKPLQFELYTFPREDSGELEMTVTAFGADNKVLYTKTFEHVKIQRNCITRYTGDFFVTNDTGKGGETDDTPDNPETETVGIMVNPAWSEVFDYTF